MQMGIRVALGSSNGTPYKTLGEVAPLVRRLVRIEPADRYIELGVRSFNKGTFHRRTVSGVEFTWQELYRVNQGDLVFSNIMAWEGAVAKATAEDDGCVGNHRMLTCECDATCVLPDFLEHYFKTSEGMTKLVAASTGTVARNRTLTASSLASITVPIPPMHVQQRIVGHIEDIANRTQQVEERLAAIESDAERLLAVQFRQIIASADYQPMAAMAPLVRRDVAISPEDRYTELGIRSFFKGTFHRRTMAGSDYTWQDLFKVKVNDLIFSNIMAWEKAIAIAQPHDDGCIGNHRMLTCEARSEVANPGFLWYYFTTPEGFAKIEAASPGTAARNKTMTAPALMAVEVPAPPIREQRSFADLQSRVAALKAQHAAIRAANHALVPATLERIFSSASAH